MFWEHRLDQVQPRNLSAERERLEIKVFSDASGTAGGSYIDGTDMQSLVMWDVTEQRKSSTWRELRALEFGLKAFAPKLSGYCVYWHSDNQAVARIATKGSMKKELNRLAFSVFTVCQEFNIQLRVIWIRRELNEQADSLSRSFDTDDWSVSKQFFEFANKTWGPFTIDRFANAKNAQLPRFNSRFWSPGCEQVDAFSVSWVRENNWLVPPPCLVSQAVKHLLLSKAKGALVVPEWKSYSYWPLLFPNKKPAWFIKNTFVVKPGCRYLVSGTQENSIFTPSRFKSNFVLVNFDAS